MSREEQVEKCLNCIYFNFPSEFIEKNKMIKEDMDETCNDCIHYEIYLDEIKEKEEEIN